MNPLRAYEAAISFGYYRFTATLGHEQLEDAVNKLLTRVLKLSPQEMAFFAVPDFLKSVEELERDESTCYQIAPSRACTLNIKRII